MPPHHWVRLGSGQRALGVTSMCLLTDGCSHLALRRPQPPLISLNEASIYQSEWRMFHMSDGKGNREAIQPTSPCKQERKMRHRVGE